MSIMETVEPTDEQLEQAQYDSIEELSSVSTPKEEVADNTDNTTDNIDSSESDSESAEKETSEEAGTGKQDSDKVIEQSIKDTEKAIEEAEETLKAKGINYDELSEEYMNTGGLSDKTYGSLEKAGYPRSVVDTYIRGVAAVEEGFTQAVYAEAGGKEGYDKLATFVASRGQDTVDAFNDAIMSGSLSTVKMLIKGIKAQQQLRTGTSNPTILGGSTGGTSGFANESEMTKAMNDERYGTDEDYTKSIAKRLSKTKFIQFGR